MKKYVVSIDEDQYAKSGLLMEVKKDGTILVIGEKYQIKNQKKPRVISTPTKKVRI